MPSSSSEGGLGAALVGEKVIMGQLQLTVTKLIGEGGFSYVYLVKEVNEGSLGASLHANAAKQLAATNAGSSNGGEDPPVRRNSGPGPSGGLQGPLVLKVTSIHSRAQRDIAEKEAKLLSRLSHPSIIKMYDTCYRTVNHPSTGKRGKEAPNGGKERPQHLILMEFCEGGHALDVCNKLASANERFDLSTLIIAFGQICNAVSYLHAQRPPIVHRDLKPVNFLVKNGAYKLCDFGSAVFGHVDLRTPKARAEAEEVIEKTTTQMFRAPEMVDLYTAKKLTQATDVWALGCCLYSLAFLQNCFEEGSNLAILSRKYTIPEDNPYGEGLVELLDRMLTVDGKARADMTEVILCLSAVYSGRPLPPRMKASRSSKSDEKEENKTKEESKKESDARVGTFRTDSQGYQENIYDPTKATEGKKLASNSVAARRKRAAAAGGGPPGSSGATPAAPGSLAPTDPLAFSSFQNVEEEQASEVAFGSDFGDIKAFDTKGESEFFGSFDGSKGSQGGAGGDGFDASALQSAAWGENGEIGPNDEEKDLESHPTASNDTDDAEPNNAATKKDAVERKGSRRKGGGGVRSRTSRPVEAGVEAMKITDADNAELDAEKKERRSRTLRSEDEKDSRQRRRSSSRSKRKSRGQRESKTEKVEEGSAEPAAVSKMGTSFRNPFNRKQPPSDP